MYLQREGPLISLNSTLGNLEAVSLAINAGKPILIEGVVGSGKTSLIEHLASITGRSSVPHFMKVCILLITENIYYKLTLK